MFSSLPSTPMTSSLLRMILSRTSRQQCRSHCFSSNLRLQLLQQQQHRFSFSTSKNFVMKKSEISNELLISLSMGFEHKQATNQFELTQNLVLNNVLKTEVVRSAFEELDRNVFAINKKQTIYGNNPLAIGDGQNMTSPLMHAFALEEITSQLTRAISQESNQTSRNPIRILDVGCGRGFIAFALAKILTKLNVPATQEIIIRGIDVHENLIEAAKELAKSSSLVGNSPNIRFEFEVMNIEDEIATKKSYKYDTIHVGVALTSATYQGLISNLFAEQNIGASLLCPVIQEDLEQNLLFRTQHGNETQVMKCVYSQMISAKQMEAQKYFLQDGDVAEDEDEVVSQNESTTKNASESKSVKSEEDDVVTKHERDLLKYEAHLLVNEAKLKQVYETFRAQNAGASPKLADLTANTHTKDLLAEIAGTKKNIKFTKAKIAAAKPQGK